MNAGFIFASITVVMIVIFSINRPTPISQIDTTEVDIAWIEEFERDRRHELEMARLHGCYRVEGWEYKAGEHAFEYHGER